MESSKFIFIVEAALNDILKKHGIDGEIVITPSWERGPMPTMRKYILKMFFLKKGSTEEILSVSENTIGTDNAAGYESVAKRLLVRLLEEDVIWNLMNIRHH